MYGDYKMENIKVSVIVPVYNTEKYLKKCLDSLVQQTLEEIEIIVVNDGSPDNSQAIIDRYVKEYPQKIVAYCKENGGLGDARNFGIDHANGEYIGFVDSDDWVDKKMFQSMYEMAQKENDDIVICDFIEINDGWKSGHIAYGYRGDKETQPIEKYMFLLYSLEPATACNKIYRRSLFYIKKFPIQWYEDVATTPILLSYANKIAYLPIALYYYRQVENSITKATRDMRTLEIMKAWNSCLTEVQSDFMEPMEAAVYKSICTFLYFKPEFAQDFIDYAKKKQVIFSKNIIIKGWINAGEVENLFEKELIPKKIHYFWFGGNPKSELILRCIESWKKHAPDYEIIEWNESNCNIHVNKYVEEAYAAGKWAFVSDYFRMEKVGEYGGIYLDTDIEIMKEPSRLLLDTAFFAFETKDAVNACIFGAIPKHPLVLTCQRSYKKSKFVNEDGTFNISYTVVRRITEQLERVGLKLNGKEQILNEGTHIYPANKLTLDMFDGEIIAQHHYDCSWWDAKVGVMSYKNTVLQDWFSGDTCSQANPDLLRERDYYKMEFERLENSTCWRITKPLRLIMDLLKKLIKRGRV